VAPSQLVPLKDLLTRSEDWLSLDPTTEYRQVTARLWGKGLKLRSLVRGADIAATKQRRVRTGQFVISKIDARHGAFGVVPRELDGAVVSTDFPAFDVRSDRLLPGFLRWISSTERFVALCAKASEGSTNRVRLKESRFLEQRIPLPPIPEQRRMVAGLEAVAEYVASVKRILSDMSREMDAAVSRAFALVVSDAPRARMAEVAPLVRRAVSIRPEAIYTEIGVRSFYRGTFHRRSMSGAEFTWQKLFTVVTGDLIFSNLMAWEQAIAVAQERDNGCIGNHRILTCAVDPTQASSEFLWYYFTTPEGFGQILRASPGSIARNKTLSSEQLRDITVPLPSIRAQRWFDRLQSFAQEAKRRHNLIDREIDQLVPAILDRLFGDLQ